MTTEQIFNDVKALMSDQLDVATEKITMNTNFTEDLDLDSLDVFEVIDQLEDQFDIEIETDDKLATVGDLVQYVATHLPDCEAK